MHGRATKIHCLHNWPYEGGDACNDFHVYEMNHQIHVCIAGKHLNFMNHIYLVFFACKHICEFWYCYLQNCSSLEIWHALQFDYTN